MTNPDELALKRIFGKGYGPADKVSLANNMPHVATAEDLSAQGGFASPGLPVFGQKVDEALGYSNVLQKQQRAALAVVRGPASVVETPDTSNVELAEDFAGEPAIDPVARELEDGWRSTVQKYAEAQTEPFTTDAVLTGAFHMESGFLDRGDQMRVAAILKALGYQSKQRRVGGGARQNLWAKASEHQIEP